MSGGETRGHLGSVAAFGIFYACFYSTVGIVLPFLPQHLRALGLSGSDIGSMLAVYPLMTTFVPPIFGLIADRTRRGPLLLTLATSGMLLSFAPLLVVAEKAAITPWIAAAAFCNAPIAMLTDSLTLERLGSRASAFPRVRLFGSLGFIAAATSFGFLYSGELGHPPPVIVAALVTTGLSFLASLRVRGRGGLPAQIRLQDASALVRDRRIRLLLTATCLHWLACSPFNLLFAVFLKEMSFPQPVAGLGLGAGVVAEVTVMACFPGIARQLPTKMLLALSFAASALRWLLVSRTTQAAPMVALQLLHGFTFGAFMVASVTYLHAVAPPKLRSTAQALFVSMTYGLGGTAGYLLVGRLYDLLPPQQIFLGAAAVETIPMALALFLPAPISREVPATMVRSSEVPP